MPLDFPSSPTNGQTYTSAGITWTFNSTYSTWDVSSAGPAGPIGYTGSGYPGTTGSAQLGSLGVGTAPSGTIGEIRANNNITAYYTSDIKFKENIASVKDAVSKVAYIGGKTFDWTDEYIAERGGEDGYFVRKRDFGVIAQDVMKVFPLAVRQKGDGTLAVDYEKLCALAFQAIKEQQEHINTLELRISTLENSQA